MAFLALKEGVIDLRSQGMKEIGYSSFHGCPIVPVNDEDYNDGIWRSKKRFKFIHPSHMDHLAAEALVETFPTLPAAVYAASQHERPVELDVDVVPPLVPVDAAHPRLLVAVPRAELVLVRVVREREIAHRPFFDFAQWVGTHNL